MENLNQIISSLENDIKAFVNESKSKLSGIDKLEARVNEISEMVDGLYASQKSVQNSGQNITLKSLLESSEDLAQLRRKGSGRAVLTIDTKALTSTNLGTTREHMGVFSAGTSAGRLYSALTVIPTDSGAVEFARVAIPSAAAVAEGAAYPGADPASTLVTLPLRSVGVLVSASKQTLEDLPGLEAQIAALINDSLISAVDSQLINGDGTGANLVGFSQAATYQVAGAGEKMLDAVARAAGTCAAVAQPDVVVLNPSDLWRIAREKDSNNAYIFSPAGNLESIYGLRVLATPGMGVDRFLVGTLSPSAAVVRQKGAVSVEISTEHSDYFGKGLVAIKGEIRLTLCVMRPGAFVYGEFNS
jgi:HK97 family phage major capsid protein